MFTSKYSPWKFPTLTVTCTSTFGSKQVNQAWAHKTLPRALNLDAAASSSGHQSPLPCSVSVTPEGAGAAQSEPALPPLLPHPSLAGRLHCYDSILIFDTDHMTFI